MEPPNLVAKHAMKLLFVGATGAIGSEVLEQCLAHPAITSVVAFSRRELSSKISSSPKLQVVIVKDFSEWPEGVLEAHVDAEAMVWCVLRSIPCPMTCIPLANHVCRMMGAYNPGEAVHIDYPRTFQQSFLKVLKARPGGPKFRDIHLSGTFVVQDQDSTLWFMSAERKVKVGIYPKFPSTSLHVYECV